MSVSSQSSTSSPVEPSVSTQRAGAAKQAAPLAESSAGRTAAADRASFANYEFILVFDHEKSFAERVSSFVNEHSAPADVAPAAVIVAAQTKKKQWTLHEKQSQLLTHLQQAGITVTRLLETHTPHHGKVKETYYGLTAPLHTMKEHAQRIELDMVLKSEYGGGYLPFQISQEHMFQSSPDHFFRQMDRYKIMQSLISSREKTGGAGINMGRLIEKGVVKQFFPLHNKAEVKYLNREWVWHFWKLQPIERIRHYFGEKLALYFVWLGYYNMWLAVAAVFGLAVFCADLAVGYNNVSAIVFSVFISFWSTFSFEFWKRKQAAVLVRWNMSKFEVAEEEMSSFHGKRTRGAYVDGSFVDLSGLRDDERFARKRVTHYSNCRRLLRTWLVIVPLVVFLNAVALGATFGLLLAQSYLQSIDVIGGPLGGIVNAVGILILEAIYVRIASALARWQNFRTNTQYEDNLIIQRFIFEFVVAYAALFYIAFVKPRLAGWGFAPFKSPVCAYDDQRCIMGELGYSLGFTFVIRILVLQAIEVLIPWIFSKLCGCCAKRRSGHKLSVLEKNAFLSSYNGTLPEYEEIVLQFGYVTLFAAAFPLAPFAALLNNLIEIRSDAFRFINSTQRPFWNGTKDIGLYGSIMNAMTYIAVVTNCALIAFTSTSYADAQTRLIIFVALENAVIFVNYLIQRAVPDVPDTVRRSQARTKFLTQELTGVDMKLNEHWRDVATSKHGMRKLHHESHV